MFCKKKLVVGFVVLLLKLLQVESHTSIAHCIIALLLFVLLLSHLPSSFFIPSIINDNIIQLLCVCIDMYHTLKTKSTPAKWKKKNYQQHSYNADKNEHTYIPNSTRQSRIPSLARKGEWNKTIRIMCYEILLLA